MKIKILSDSTCDLSQELLEKYDISLMPLTVIKDGKAYSDGVNIVPVPSSYLPENVEIIIAHKSAVVSPVKLSEYKTHIDPPGINGTLVEGRVYYDAFVLESKAKGIAVHKKA